MSMSLTFLSVLFALFYTTQAYATLTLDATRYIYDGDEQSVSVVVSNGSEKEFGAQVWVDNIEEKDTRPTFVTTPSFFKIKADGKQVFRILNVSDKLPQDKESIYWLNLQEIPPAQKGSGIAMAIRTQVKLIYRPEGLAAARNEAEQNLSVEHLPGEKWLVNTTPYVFAIGTVFDEQDNAVPISEADKQTLTMFKPGDRVKVTGHTVKSVSALNDYGSMKTYELVNKND